jgi:transcriptional regulator with XRE-family HTH domain
MELEEKLLRIIDSRESGANGELAQDLGLTLEEIDNIENEAKIRVRNVLKRGNRGVRKVARASGFSEGALVRISDYYDLEIPRPRKKYAERKSERKSRSERIKEIKQAVLDGAKTPEEIAERVGLRANTVEQYVSLRDLGISRVKSKEERIEEVKQAVLDGAKTPEEVAKKMGVSPAYVIDLSCKGKLDVPFSKSAYLYISKKRDPETDEFLRQGLTLEEIGRLCDLNRESIRQYEIKTNQKGIRMNAKREKEKKESKRINVLEGIVYQINEVAKRQVPEEDMLAYDKAMSLRTKDHNFYDLFLLFKTYYDAKREGEILSLEKIGRSCGFSTVAVGNILKRVGEEPLNGARERKRLTPEEIRMYEKARDAGLSGRDIDYFLKSKERAATYFMTRKIYQDRPQGVVHEFSLRKSSEIYQALDLGFEVGDLKELLGIFHTSVINYALENRDRISKNLVKGLKVLFPERKIEKPYLE